MNKIDEMKNKIDKFQEEDNKRAYDNYARLIVGFKVLHHVIIHLPKAYREKRKVEANNTIENKNSLYKNNSVFDYIDDPNFEYNEEVEKASNKIEKMSKKVNNTMKTIRKKTSPFYWLKVFFDKIRGNNIKKLPKGNLKTKNEIYEYNNKVATDAQNVKYKSNEINDKNVKYENKEKKEFMSRIYYNVNKTQKTENNKNIQEDVRKNKIEKNEDNELNL